MQNLSELAPLVGSYINQIYYLLLAVAMITLVVGVFKFVANAGNEQGRKAGRQVILWGVIGIFVITSIWGIVNILQNTLELGDDSNPNVRVPQIVGN